MGYFSAQELSAIKSDVSKASAPKPKQKQRGRGGFLSSLISEAGGTGGAASGAALGASVGSVVPGIGTAIGGLVGAGLGGFLGGTGGRVVENKVRDNRIGIGDALKEGAISGVASAGPLRLLKGAKGAIKGAAKGATAAETAIERRTVAKGIPVKFSSDELTGKGVSSTRKKTLTNPKIGDLADELDSMRGQGYSISQRSGRTPGSLSPLGERGLTPDFTPITSSPKLSSVELTGKKTQIPLTKSGITQRGVINTPDQYVDNVVELSPAKSRGQNALQGANDALTGGRSFLSKLTKAKEGTAAAGKRLTEAGSGLKADKNVGGVERLDKQAEFMSKYTGTPRQQRIQMESDMKNLSKQVDEHLANTKTPVVGINMSTKLKNAIDDPNVFPELDLTQPRAIKLIEKNMKILGGKTEAQDTNNFVKTINPTAVKARDKLAQGLPLTPNETAALATKRVIDEELSSIPEIAPLKKQMAQIFDVTPQVAKQAEKGISSPFLGGIKLKAPIQAASGAASKAGGILTKLSSGLPEVTTPAAPGVAGFASRILAGRGLDNALDPSAAVQQPVAPVQEDNPNIGQQATAITTDDILANEAQGTDNNPFSPENAKKTVESILAQGGTMKDVQEYLANAKAYNDLTATTSGSKPLNSTAAGVVADTTTGLKQLQALSKDIGSSNANNPVVGFLRSKNPLDTNAQSLQASIATAKQIVGKALEGGVLRKEDEAKYAKILPTINDTDAVAQAKIQKLITAISGRLTEYQAGISGGSGGTDLATLGL